MEVPSLMQRKAGEKLGPYEIVALLGEGGMGEVYRARDPRLGRDVAIKTSHQQFNERFEREARAVAALNHPNICHLYDVGHDFIVMELVEGANLEGPLPLPEVLQIARQIAAALEAAHEKGIVHRDLKPANIRITEAGVVKVLDFGLARMGAPDTGDSAEARTTMASPTIAGTILGTAAYMAPEQARGKAVDKRADIWAFGVVLYELSTGARLFEGETVSDILAGVLKEEPDLSAVPVELRRLIAKCLAKDPKQRLRDIADAWELLDTSHPPAAIAPHRSRFAARVWMLAAAVLAVGFMATSWIAYRATRPTAAAATTRTTITVPANRPVNIAGNPTRSLAISPDGTELVYVATNLDSPANRPGGRGQLQVRSLASLEVRDLPGTTDARQPFFSPDGQWVAFFTRTGELLKISLAGGTPITLAEKINGSQWSFGVWTEDNTIVFGTVTTGLRRVSAEGGAVTDLTTLAPGESGHLLPALVPSSRAVLFARIGLSGGVPRVEAVMPDSGKRRVVLENADAPLVLSSGYLLFLRGENILMAPFDATRLTVTGPAVPLIDKVRRNASDFLPEMAVSRSGTLAYLPATDTAGALGIVGRDGLFQPLGPPPGDFENPRVSPDGRSVAYIVRERQKSAVSVYDVQRGSTTKLTQDSDDDAVAWRPDSRSLAIHSQRKDASGVFLRNPDGSDRLLMPDTGPPGIRNFSWAPDGKQLAYTVQNGSLHDIWIMTMGEKPTMQPFLNSPASEYSPAFSPDGRWLAYVSDESGRPEIYLHGYPEGERLAVSTGGGNGAVWRRDGKELYFQGAVDGVPKMMAVAVTPEGASLRLAPPVPLFDLRVTGPAGAIEQYVVSSNGGVRYDVLPDGRFVMIRRADPAGIREIVVVQNWFEELKRLAPGK
jgi:eukaryotic-like serine/threonine-protein kinase